MNKKILSTILIAFLLADLSYSFLQYLSLPLDGDMAWNLVPFEGVKTILKSPFGLEAFINETIYPNPNRFFCHWIYRTYLIEFPLFIQNFTTPVDSVYIACAIAQIVTHVSLLYLLSSIALGRLKITLEFLILSALLTPLFQTNGYSVYMAIIDKSTTYTFFYALPCVFLLIYFLPFIFSHFHNTTIIRGHFKYVWLIFIPVICLSGPLNTGAILVFSALLFLKESISFFQKSRGASLKQKIVGFFKSLPSDYWIYVAPAALGSFYSLYIGGYNALTIGNKIPIYEAYSRLPLGVYYLLSQKIGLPLLIIILAINWVIINKHFRETSLGSKILHYYKYIGFFTLIYILLLPLGGYRSYRPNILRYDTILPITLSFLFLYAVGVSFILRNFIKNNQYKYIAFLVIISLNYTIVDEPKFDRNQCEKESLKNIYSSNTCDYRTDYGCSVLTWSKNITDEDIVENKKLLKIWKICQ